MSKKNELPIAVIDSGVGGISVLRELMRIMPNENYLYYGDSANAPYGIRDKKEVLKITENNLLYLKRKGIKALVIACNTATSAAAAPLRKKNPDLPIIGIEPAIKPAAVLLENPIVLVMATPLTLSQEKFTSLAQKYNPNASIIPLPCDGLASLIEAGAPESDIRALLKKLFSSVEGTDIDSIVLGCTHYPLIEDMIAEIFPDARIFDGGLGTALQTRRRLSELGLLSDSSEKGKITVINSAGDHSFAERAMKHI